MLVCLLTACAVEPADPVGESQASITNGTYDPNDHQVVKVFPPGSPLPCTGTLIGRRTVLTAAHCLGAGPITVSGEAWVFDPTMGRGYWDPYTVQGTPMIQQGSDLALVILPMNIPGMSTSRVATSVWAGLPITLIGYGQTAGGVGGGVRYLATNTIDSVGPVEWLFSGTGGAEGATCHGDSGGPAYETGTDCIVGITAGGPNNCSNDLSYSDTRVDTLIGWIQNIAPEAIATCTP